MDLLKKKMGGRGGGEYLVFDSTNENKEVSKIYAELWDWIKMTLRS